MICVCKVSVEEDKVWSEEASVRLGFWDLSRKAGTGYFSGFRANQEANRWTLSTFEWMSPTRRILADVVTTGVAMLFMTTGLLSRVMQLVGRLLTGC